MRKTWTLRSNNMWQLFCVFTKKDPIRTETCFFWYSQVVSFPVKKLSVATSGFMLIWAVMEPNTFYLTKARFCKRVILGRNTAFLLRHQGTENPPLSFIIFSYCSNILFMCSLISFLFCFLASVYTFWLLLFFPPLD